MAETTLQELSDFGLNPFAVKLLVESFKRMKHHRGAEGVSFVFDGVKITVSDYVFPILNQEEVQHRPDSPG